MLLTAKGADRFVGLYPVKQKGDLPSSVHCKMLLQFLLTMDTKEATSKYRFHADYEGFAKTIISQWLATSLMDEKTPKPYALPFMQRRRSGSLKPDVQTQTSNLKDSTFETFSETSRTS